MKYFVNQCGTPYVVCVSKNIGEREISKTEYDALIGIAKNAPQKPEGYEYKLRADDLEWELVKLPPVPDAEDEPTIEDKAEAYDILMGGGDE